MRSSAVRFLTFVVSANCPGRTDSFTVARARYEEQQLASKKNKINVDQELHLRSGFQFALSSSSSSGDGSLESVGARKKSINFSHQSWVTLITLLLIYMNSQWSRNVLPNVVNFSAPLDSSLSKKYMNIDLNFDEKLYGALASYGFTVLFSASSLVAGRVADTYSKKTVVVVSCALWSIVTLLNGFSKGTSEIIVLRALQGIFQAFTNPAAYAMLSLRIPPESRATSNAVYSSGIFLGGSLASLTIILNENIGWRNCFVAAGAVGLLCSTLGHFIIQDVSIDKPAYKSVETTGYSVALTRTKLIDTFKTIYRSKVAMVVFLASSLRFMAGFSVAVWLAPFMKAQFPDRLSDFAAINAIFVAVGGCSSSFLGGLLSDRLSLEDNRFQAWIPMIGSLLAVPCWYFITSSDNFSVVMGFLLFKYLLAECWLGPTIAILQGTLPKEVQGTAQGILSVTTAIGNTAPLLIGSAVSYFALKDLLLYSICVMYAASSVAFYLLSKLMSRRKSKIT